MSETGSGGVWGKQYIPDKSLLSFFSSSFFIITMLVKQTYLQDAKIERQA